MHRRIPDSTVLLKATSGVMGAVVHAGVISTSRRLGAGCAVRCVGEERYCMLSLKITDFWN